MKQIKTFQFRLRPTKKQRRALGDTLDACRWLYNNLLGQRKTAYEICGYSINKYQQQNYMPYLKIHFRSLLDVHSQVLQNVGDRLDKAFKAFFRRVKNGEKPGYPRFCGVDRYNSFCYPQSGFSLGEHEVKLSKIGKIRLKQHRQISGTVKTCTVKRNTCGEWDILFSCEVEISQLPKSQKSVGIDVGIENFATFDDGFVIENPRHFRKLEVQPAKDQKKFSKLKKGTRKRRKLRIRISKKHKRTANRRKNFCHQESKKIINKYQNIFLEDLDITTMVKGSYYAKSITDAGWGMFRQYLTYKAEYAGRNIGLVNPAYTTQDCSECGNREKKKITEREHSCSSCNFTSHRDVNAARNISALGIDGLGKTPRSFRL